MDSLKVRGAHSDDERTCSKIITLEQTVLCVKLRISRLNPPILYSPGLNIYMYILIIYIKARQSLRAYIYYIRSKIRNAAAASYRYI